MKTKLITFYREGLLLLFLLAQFPLALADEALNININYYKQNVKRPPALSNVLEAPQDSGAQGARLGVDDSNSTGKFLKQRFNLDYIEFDDSSEVLEQLERAYTNGEHLFVLDVPKVTLIAADRWAHNKQVLLFNISDSSDELRSSQCLTSTLHTAPSNAMRSDAIAQWLLYRRFNKVLLVYGTKEEDRKLSESFRRSSKRFGLEIVDEKQWTFNSDLRRSAQQEIPLFTQTDRNYDVVYVADPSKDFAEYFPFNTYIPRPVVGSAGLEALTWHVVIEQWGAAQVQKRFRELAQRSMNELDFGGYLAVRSIAQAIHKKRTSSNKEITNFIKSEQFELAAYKGRKLSYRPWSGQLRIPMALVQPNGLVSLSPQAGVLHPRTELDTLGFDIEESQCVSQKEQI
ncbi:branched-chain amino acid ABC transporter substrate-binding protein [Vibrio panuliri]|uniref:Branched-chain amino acid ABC transporter substrate-binding protein n=1 Tax=Vibrio panuliri TaxID=1381081 RepID=A0A1Q9HAZ4_9VIBR|nr:ABC transporter substrate-binding protein [Vibrio panuliri]OLQ86312.1 branched-chain amino acid ABC transporter substrate-binding protein [Vibrio panuliri]